MSLLAFPAVLRAAETFSDSTAPQQQQQKTRTLSGTVLDAVTNEPVIGAAVQVRGRQGGEITDLDGMFTINVPSGAVITVTSLGYRSQSLNVGTRDNIRILLEPDSEVLEDVVVTAFGVGQKKESVVGAVQLVRPESLIVPSANLSTAFAGRLAGVVSFQRSGMPGQNGSDFYIRGISTISGVTSPLIILDGVEISAGDLNAIDPEIIEGFSILKDATATAMYGTRGANGVMIITTKSGRDLDRPIIGFRIETNVTTPTRLPKFVDGARYMELFNEAVTNQGTGDVLFSKERIDGTRKRLNPYVYPDVNWYDEIFRNHAFNQKVNFNIRGGTGKITYFMNLTVNHETGMLRDRSKDFFSFSNGINVMKYAFQNNIDFHMSKSSTISLHLNAQVNDITWEIGRKVNAGVEMELFGSLSLTMEAFREIRSNIFQQKLSIPNYLGTANTVIYGNLAKVKNYGFDISAEFGKSFSKDFYVQFLGTFTYARNKVLEYDEAPGTRPANSRIGHPVNTIYGFISDGLYIDQADLDRSPESTLGNIAIAPGDIKYIDQPDKNGKLDGKITTDDVVAMGYPTVPEIVYGFGPTITYRNVDFSFFLQGAARTSLMMSGFHPFGAQYNRNVLQFVADDHWSPTNQNIRAAYPRLTKYENNHNSRASDFWLRDASFLKLKNVEVGWRIRNVRVYANAVNVLTFSRFKHWDPEMGGGAGMQYPTQRTFNLGLQVTFK